LAISIESDVVLNTRKTTKYEIDMSKCIYCGFCQEACPVEAIVESNNYEYFINNRSQFIFKKNKLLTNGLKWETELFHNIKTERLYK
jgi:formate hydrogenlyase subunit 6/NADH:ubiquinone oxidoreductase subunit I